MGNTPFALAYGLDVVIPIEIGMPTTRTSVQGRRNESQEHERYLDWADKVRESAAIWMASYQQRDTAYYNRKVQSRAFKVKTLVLRKVFENTTKKGVGKL